MYKIVPWSEDLDLSNFYKLAQDKGFINNACQRTMVDCFRNELEWQVWILFYNEQAVGSVAAHSFPEMGNNAYRIAARTCVFTEMIPTTALRTRNQIITHQHVTGQFLIPACIEWAPKDSRLYITSNENEAGTQRLVHRIYGPAMESSGQMTRVKNMFYRGTEQTVWELLPKQFYKALNKSKRW